MVVRFQVAELLRLDASGRGRVTQDELLAGGGKAAVQATSGSGSSYELAINAKTVGLVSHLVSRAAESASRGVASITIAEAMLEQTPTDRVLAACDSYLPSLRSMAPGQVLDVLLAHPDPKIGVFDGGLRDEAGEFKSYQVVDESGALTTRKATYNGEKLFFYVPAHETGALERMQSLQADDERYANIEIVPFRQGDLSSREARLETRFDRPGVIWISSRCDVLPEIKDDNYLVPGSRFAIEVYYHDARINAPGARSTIEQLQEKGDEDSLSQAKVVLSALRGTTNVFVNQINTLGKVLNANLTLYAGRSQPPALTTCIKETYQAWTKLHADDTKELENAKVWLQWATAAAVKEYDKVWMAEPRIDSATGLSRYVDEVPSQAPEEPTEHYEGMTWNADAISSDAAVREHGWDSHVGAMAMEGPFAGQPIQHRMLPACLNTVLFKVEKDLAELHQMTGKPEDADRFLQAAAKRKTTMNRIMWNDERGMYSDLIYNPDDPNRSPSKQGEYIKNTYEDLRGLMAMWAGLVTPKGFRAVAMRDRVRDFMRAGGLATATEKSWARAVELNKNYVGRSQWGQKDVGWPIAAYETSQGLRACGFDDLADEADYRWCWTVQREAERQGGLRISERGEFEAPVTEKIDVTAQSLEDAAEEYGYGNQGRGTDGHAAGFRWGYDAFKLSARALPAHLQKALANQVHPDALFVDRNSPPLTSFTPS